MKESVKNVLIEKFNDGLTKVVENTVKENIGVNTKFQVKVEQNKWSGFIITLIEDGNDVSKQLTATPLLSHLFRGGSLNVSVEYDEKSEKSLFRVQISYNHRNGGSNGYELLRFSVDSYNHIDFYK